MKAVLIKDKHEEGYVYRVECIDDDGGCEVAVFSGPDALIRAARFGTAYYDVLDDPQGLLQ